MVATEMEHTEGIYPCFLAAAVVQSFTVFDPGPMTASQTVFSWYADFCLCPNLPLKDTTKAGVPTYSSSQMPFEVLKAVLS